MNNPIRTATIPLTTNAAMLLIQHAPGDAITYASIHCDPAQAIDMLRRALIHLVAEQAGLATVPATAAILANGHGPSDTPHPSEPSHPSDIPPLRVPKNLPKSTPAPARKKPGPKPGTPRKPKSVPTYSLSDLGLDEDEEQ